jgi:hypothetical protein
VKHSDSLVQRLIILVKQHKKPSSPKSVTVLLKVMDDQILQPGNHSVDKLKNDLRAALYGTAELSTMVRQQHSEEELRACLANLLKALEEQ